MMALLNLEIDGKPTQIEAGKTVMEAAKQLGIKIPHFCYHKKLSIAANCRMCLVQVEKAPKPLPACATPVSEGMKVSTHSEFAIKAQKAVMEFLLINHPLDCPICDQGGECKLQDVSMGYGGGASRYEEPKRVVANKNIGPLIQTDMTRCILCTRCVRYGQEIAGVMELGVGGRGEHSEILAFMDLTVDSEVSGNAIDLCPVGALTSKPFRYAARSWELQRHPGISPHDGLGTHIDVQVKQNTEVLRVLPRAEESINECWISDRDRFSYQALHSADRLLEPKIKRDGKWETVDWTTALQYTVDGLEKIKATHGTDALGALISPQLTLEEGFLLQKLMRSMGSPHIDHRIRQADFTLDVHHQGSPWMGVSVEHWSRLSSVLMIGCRLRSEQPLLSVRLRRNAKKGALVHLINPFLDDLAMPVAAQLVGLPSQLPNLLAQVLIVVAKEKGVALSEQWERWLGAEISPLARSTAQSLLNKEQGSVVLGAVAQHHPEYAALYLMAQKLSELLGYSFGVLGEASNSVGMSLVGAVPFAGPLGSPVVAGHHARELFRQPKHAYVMMGIEPDQDCNYPQEALDSLKKADLVVSIQSFEGQAQEWATVLLPLAPFTEMAGSYVSMEGRYQQFNGIVNPKGSARPGWKILRVLGHLLGLEGFDFETIEEVRNILSPDLRNAFTSQLSNEVSANAWCVPREQQGTGLERLGEVPIYRADGYVRRAAALQSTCLEKGLKAWMNQTQMIKLGLQINDRARFSQNHEALELMVDQDDRLLTGCVAIPMGYFETAVLGASLGAVLVEKVVLS